MSPLGELSLALSAPTIHDYAAWREGSRSFDALGAHYNSTVNLSGDRQGPERLRGAFASASVFELLGVRPVLGRLFHADDQVAGAQPVILLGSEVWQRRFAGDRAVLGTTVRANGVETVIAGVLPEGFGFPESQQVWLPLRMDPARVERGAAPWVQVTGRLRDGVTIEAAHADLGRIATGIAQEHPETHRGMSVRIAKFSVLSDQNRTMIFIMLGAVFAVLLIACVNVANLLIGRAIVRTKEVGVRIALGASRGRVALPFLAESTVLALAGRDLGVRMAMGARPRVLVSLVMLQGMRQVALGLLIGSVFAFALSRGIAAALFGVTPDDPLTLVSTVLLLVTVAALACAVPALRATRIDPLDALRSE
jgi:hypothetical protein